MQKKEQFANILNSKSHCIFSFTINYVGAWEGEGEVQEDTSVFMHYMYFSNSLTIHKENFKNINV